MSVFNNTFVKHTGESMGLENLSEDVMNALTQDMEYRIREIIQESKKFMRHSRRSFLSTQDINSALKVKNVEPLYGYLAPRPVKFKRADANVFYMDDEDLDFDKVLATPLPKLPLDVSLSAHWLSIDGVQPAIPQNPPPHSIDRKGPSATTPTTAIPGSAAASHSNGGSAAAGHVTLGPSSGSASAAAPGAISTSGQLLVKDVLSKELQEYYEKITEAVVGSSNEIRDAALASIATDPGLQALLPYFIKFAHDRVSKNLKNLRVLVLSVSFLEKLLSNENFFLEPYLHQIIPILLTTIVGKQLCSDPAVDDHWTLRRHAASLLASILNRFADQYPTLLPRVTKTLLVALVDDAKPLTTKFGAVVALSMLGVEVGKVCLVPNARKYATTVFEPAAAANGQAKEDAMDVDGAAPPTKDGSSAPNGAPAKDARGSPGSPLEVGKLLDAYASALASIHKTMAASDLSTAPGMTAVTVDHAALRADYGDLLADAVIKHL
ncbi:histone H4-like TAF Taf6, SAGA complex subunit [Blastocladiella emersonii ATCC 22665]|nr:histone H4-like TAF Taf6, SAGA complex subunit [Blastocladiella emersonii ATCC 22665]